MISFRSGNPALRSKTFEMDKATGEGVMTLEGTINKVTIGLFILLSTAFYTFSTENTSLMWVGVIGGLITALVTIFKKEWAPFTVPLYAALEGLALGGISFVFDTMYPGIAQQAILLTFGIFGALLFAYKTKIIQATENFKLGIFAATAGIGVAYLINLLYMWCTGDVLSFMSMGEYQVVDGETIVVTKTTLMSVGFSMFVVVIAALNLVLDFDFIEQGAEAGIPKYMEWYGAFGLLVTLVWLYLEILRLLAKLQSRR